MNLLPYIDAVIKSVEILPEEMANRIQELASTFEASCYKEPEPDWDVFDRMESMVLSALDTVHGFREVLDNHASGVLA